MPYFAYVAFLMAALAGPGGAFARASCGRAAARRATLDRLASTGDASPTEAGWPRRSRVEPIDIGELRPLVRASGSAHLAWFVTPAATYAWLISPDGQVLDFHLHQGQEEVAAGRRCGSA